MGRSYPFVCFSEISTWRILVVSTLKHVCVFQFCSHCSDHSDVAEVLETVRKASGSNLGPFRPYKFYEFFAAFSWSVIYTILVWKPEKKPHGRILHFVDRASCNDSW